MPAKLLYRILWWIPTLFGILAITFGLVKLTPGDAVEAYLDLDGGPRPAAEEMYQLYNESAAKLGLDQPNFYFDITPYHYDQTLYNWPYTDQELAFAMLEKGMSWDYALKIHRILDQMLSSENTTSELRLSLQGLIRDADTEAISDTLNRLSLMVEVDQSIERKASFWLPKFHWHGPHNQFHQWMRKFFRLDFGISSHDGQPVRTKIVAALPWTLLINITSILVAYLLAIPIGVYAGWYAGSRFDRITNFVLTILYAIPVFWMATMMVVFFSTSEFGTWTNIFPPVGIWYSQLGDSFSTIATKNIGQFTIPVFTLSTAMLAYIARQIRGSISEEKKAAYVFQAYAKGLSEHHIMWKHAFRNASFPLITLMGSILPASISGSLVLEIICNIPGMGRLLYDSIYQQDWPVLVGVVSITAVLTILGLLMADLLYRMADPRLESASL